MGCCPSAGADRGFVMGLDEVKVDDIEVSVGGFIMAVNAVETDNTEAWETHSFSERHSFGVD